jgi:hypothetical protein
MFDVANVMSSHNSNRNARKSMKKQSLSFAHKIKLCQLADGFLSQAKMG